MQRAVAGDPHAGPEPMSSIDPFRAPRELFDPPDGIVQLDGNTHGARSNEGGPRVAEALAAGASAIRDLAHSAEGAVDVAGADAGFAVGWTYKS